MALITVLSGTVTIPAGATSVNIPVAITDDNIVEGSRNTCSSLTNVTGDPDITLSATAADLTAQTEILDNDTAVISITSPGASFYRRCWYGKLCCEHVQSF